MNAEDNQDQPSDHQDGVGDPLPVVQQEPTEKAEPEPNKDRAPRGPGRPVISRLNRKVSWLFALNVLVGVSGALQAYFAYESTRLSRESFRTDQRAWLLAAEMRLPEFILAVGPLRGDVVIQNVGRSPAMGVEPEIRMFIKELAVPFPVTHFKICDERGCPQGFVDNVGSGIARTIHVQTDIAEGDLEQLRAGTTSVFVYGSVTYRDIFGEHRGTQLCYQSILQSKDEGTFIFRPCGYYNDAS